MEPLDLFDYGTSLLSDFKLMYNYTCSTYCTLNCDVTFALHRVFYYVIKLRELLKWLYTFASGDLLSQISTLALLVDPTLGLSSHTSCATFS